MAKRIRPIALGLIEHEGYLFVSRGKDPKTSESFYRFLGGGIDFGETSQAALEREFLEEVQAEYITCLDNIFVYNGKPKHELIQLFRAQFVDSKFFQLQETVRFVVGERVDQALWIETSRVLSGEYRLVPESCHQYLNA